MKNISKIEKIVGFGTGVIILDVVLTPLITGDKSLSEIIGTGISIDKETFTKIITYPVIPAFATYLIVRKYLQKRKNKDKGYSN